MTYAGREVKLDGRADETLGVRNVRLQVEWTAADIYIEIVVRAESGASARVFVLNASWSTNCPKLRDAVRGVPSV